MKQDPSRGGGSTLSPAYSAALEQLAKRRKEQKSGVGDAVLGGLKGALGLAVSPVATVADIAAKPFEAIPGVPDFNPEDIGSVNLFVQGGKSLQHVYGDAKELGRSIITGKDTLSQSPSARAYQAAGGGLTGTLAAAGPYLDVGSVVAPMAMGAARGAGLVAPKPVPYTPLTAADIADSQARSVRIVPDTTPTPMTRDDLLSYVRRARTMGTTRAKMPDEFEVASDYFGPNFPQYQNALREGLVDDVMAANIAKARTLFENSYPLDRPTILYRGIKNPNYLPRKQYADFVKGLKVGDVIEEPGFMSTTIDKDMAEGFANGGFVFEIDAPQGTSVISPLMNDELMRPYADPERELLMAPNTKLEITGIEGNTIRARVVPSDTPASVYRTTRNALAEDMAQTTPEVTASQAGRAMNPVEDLVSAKTMVDSEVIAPQAARVAPGFIMPEPVPVGNIGKLPSGVDVQLATPEQSVAFVAEQGSLDQVPTEHLWQTITENSGPGKRFEQIGGGGGATGMDRFRDTVTGQQMGLKHVPGEQNLVANGFIARTFFETLSDDVGSAVGIPRMGVRTVVNSDGSVSLVTELAQSVYDGEIMDSFQAMTRSPDGAPALGNRVTVNSRIRKALLDDLLENGDVHDGNQLFVINNDGTVDIIPIDLEHTFSSMQSVLNPQNFIRRGRGSKVFSVDDVREIRWGQFSDVDRKGVENWSLRNRIVQDTDNLRDEIQAVIETVQQQLSVDNLEREMKLRIDEIGRSYQRVAGANSANLDKFLKQASQTVELFMTRIRNFLDTPAKDIADTYIKAIEAGVFA